VVQAYNPSYSGSRDQEDLGSKPAQANSSVSPYHEKTFTQKGLVKWLKVKALSSSPVPQTNKQTKDFESLSLHGSHWNKSILNLLAADF
jgi:hypothetical protein